MKNYSPFKWTFLTTTLLMFMAFSSIVTPVYAEKTVTFASWGGGIPGRTAHFYA
ncbi:hypothetical protein QUF75_10540 [Desulfococcaceae bacterium HSG7]|nr:hypothetical protein [Desulfococcaceae bacterium HSG7]